MQQGDLGSVSYYQYPPNPHPHPQYPTPNPNPNPSLADHQPNPLPPSYASAPPFSSSHPSSDYSAYFFTHPPCTQNPDPVHTAPPTAPSYSASPTLQAFNPSSQPTSFSPYAPASADAPGRYLTPTQQQHYPPPFDQHQPAPNYPPPPQPASFPPNPNHNPNPIAPYSSHNLSSYGLSGSSIPPVYDNSFVNSLKFDNSADSFDETSSQHGLYGGSRSDSGSEPSGKRYDGGGTRYNPTTSIRDDSFGDGVYAYDGGKVQPYGSRGTSSKSSTWSGFDDFGRSINFPSGKDQVTPPKVVKAVPKADAQQDAKSWVQKFRVALLPESGGPPMDILCQICLEGIYMLDPSSSRTLRIYPLGTVTRCDVIESSTFAFWSKSSVDIEPRRIRLKSNSYTTSTLLDTVTAAMVQVKEIGGRMRPANSSMAAEQPTDKKKGFGDWMIKLKPANEEKDHWVPDEAIAKCTACGTDFGAFVRRHHCRNCGDIFCNKCTNGRIALTADEFAQPVRVCDRCLAEVTQRLNNAKEVSNKPAGQQQSHEDLAKKLQSHEDPAEKLQDEMDKNRKASSGSNSDGSGRRMREVACPTCTVHLQVQVPSSGSETIECGVCQHPFLVGAH